LADWALNNMEYSSEEDLGSALHKHLGYASDSFDKAVKLAEFKAILEADSEMHQRMKATLAAHAEWFNVGEKKQTWAEAVSLVNSPATLPSSSSSSSKRTDRLFPADGTSTIASSTPHPSGPASVSASGSGSGAAVEHNKAVEQQIAGKRAEIVALRGSQVQGSCGDEAAAAATVLDPASASATAQRTLPLGSSPLVSTSFKTPSLPLTTAPTANDFQSDGQDSASYDPDVNTHFELPTLHWKGLTFTAKPTSEGVKGNCWVSKSVEGDTHSDSDLSFVRFARFDSHSRSPSPGSPPRSSRPPSPGTPDGTPPGTPHGPPPGPPPNSYLYSTQ
jgi:hypothetical protein